MEDVIEASQIDFEESGVDQQTLDELREVWQRKLSSLNVASFPWEPPPAPPPIVNPPTVPSNVSRPPPAASQQSASPTAPVVPASNGAQNGPAIKTEPGYEPGMSGLPAASGISNQAAQQRAASLMQQQFGNQASKQIGALQAGIALPGQQIPGQQQRPQGLQLPGQQVQGQPPQYPPQQPAQQPPPAQQQQSRNGVGNAQTDGPGDVSQPWETEAMMSSTETDEIDHLIRRRIEQMGLEMEAGGLMLPLSEKKKKSRQAKMRKIAKNRSVQPSSSSLDAEASSSAAASAPSPRMPRYDGGEDSEEEKDDFDEDDEDAINSDLDDPEENLDPEDDDDEAIGQNMLCTYDKVQRVKNKWKCTLKDGVLTTGGKE
ncbi:MAG: hypothetical protein M1819_000660 [Sarea resinae]|nr:MAG: hypothetical protein M1819_000660 [Sarea resinae]